MPSGDIVFTGSTDGTLFGESFGGRDGFLMKMDSSGNEIWGKQFGTERHDWIFEMEADNKNNLYIGGITKGAVNGEKISDNIFINKFDEDGNLIQEKIIATHFDDYLSEIYVDESCNIYIAGNTYGKIGKNSYGNSDCFIMKLDSNFSVVSTFQFGTEESDRCNDFIIDQNEDFYFVGITEGVIGDSNIGKADAFLTKYTKKGKLIMSKQFGTGNIDGALNILIDHDTNIYISGFKSGSKEKGWNSDIYLRKMDKKANLIWEKEFGTTSWDLIWHMDFVHSQKEIVISGNSSGRVKFETGHSKPGAFVQLFDTNGNLKWSQVFRPQGTENSWIGGRHFAVYNDKYIYFTGANYGNLFGTNSNQKTSDIFVIKLGFYDE